VLEPNYVWACKKFLEKWYEIYVNDYAEEHGRPLPFPDEECPQRLMMATHSSHGIALRELMRSPATLRTLVGLVVKNYARDSFDTPDMMLEVLADTLALVNVGAYRLSVGPIDNMLLSMWNGFVDEWRVTRVGHNMDYRDVRFCGVKYSSEEDHDRHFKELHADIIDPMSMKWAVVFYVDPSLVHRRACKQLRRARTLWRDRILAVQAAEAL